MVKIQQVVNGKVVYDSVIKDYNYTVAQFVRQGATKLTVEYPTCTVIVTFNQEK